jgi:hypothetical protein
VTDFYGRLKPEVVILSEAKDLAKVIAELGN